MIIYIVLQEGGASTEWYATSYNTMQHANDAIASHQAATYNAYALPPISVPDDNSGLEQAILELCEHSAKIGAGWPP